MHSKPLDQRLLTLTLPTPGDLITPDQATELAVIIGYQGIGQVSPNPLVGCVIVDKNHHFLAIGSHKQYGENHAEINAIESLGDKRKELLKGATIYVTLEPCAHEGKTPSCAKTIANLPVKRVIYGCVDPNEKVAGKGIEILKKAGIEVESMPIFKKKASKLAEIFFTNKLLKRPFIGLKAGLSLDGSIGFQGDHKSFITNEAARNYGHYLRIYYDAIAVGPKTLVLDNPELNCRHSSEAARDPAVVIFDPKGVVLNSVKFDDIHCLKYQRNVYWILPDNLELTPGIAKSFPFLEFIQIPTDQESRRFTPKQSRFIFEELLARRVCSLLLEGGAGLYNQFMDFEVIDSVHLFYAPVVFTGDERINIFAATPKNQSFQVQNPAFIEFDGNFLVEGKLLRTSTP